MFSIANLSQSLFSSAEVSERGNFADESHGTSLLFVSLFCTKQKKKRANESQIEIHTRKLSSFKLFFCFWTVANRAKILQFNCNQKASSWIIQPKAGIYVNTILLSSRNERYLENVSSVFFPPSRSPASIFGLFDCFRKRAAKQQQHDAMITLWISRASKQWRRRGKIYDYENKHEMRKNEIVKHWARMIRARAALARGETEKPKMSRLISIKLLKREKLVQTLPWAQQLRTIMQAAAAEIKKKWDKKCMNRQQQRRESWAPTKI